MKTEIELSRRRATSVKFSYAERNQKIMNFK